ncbi:MAG: hypothetical protein BWY59_01278 [Verrucomicrobia bacterium ADurb.Bin345]|nr:MAG: hypothetical protein BWY59_01278 [Verrucomicrobia bacterium ADurb.Bin345]
MTTDRKHKAKPVSFVPGFLAFLVLGGLFGAFLCNQRGDFSTQRVDILFGIFCVGFAWAYLAIQALAILREFFAQLRNPLPDSLDIGDRAAVSVHVEAMKGRSLLAFRVRNLLQVWVSNGDPQTVIDLASLQSRLAGRSMSTGGVFCLALFLIATPLYANLWMTWGGMAALALLVYLRQLVLNNADQYIEARLLSRMPARIPQTAMTAADLADALGEKIQAAFRDSVPQPEKTAEAIKGAVDQVMVRVAGEVEKLQQVLIQGQSSLVDRWMHAAEATTTDLKNVESALSTIVNDLTGGLSTNAEKMTSMFNSHTKEIDKALSSVVEKLQGALKEHAELVKASGGDWGNNVKNVLSEHVNSIEAANHELADQLEKVATLEKNIENVLHIQQVVDGTLKTVSASEEFSKLISTLREHLDASDALLREVSKPRTIRLVETEGEIVEAEVRAAPPKKG